MQISTGKIPGAQKVLVYGPEGIGKSTFVAHFPEPLFIDTEGSTKHMDVRRLDAPSSWTMLMQQVTWVKENPTTCKTLVIDTVDWAEQLCVMHVCAKAQKGGIEDFGYGKGYTYLAEEFGRLLNLLSEVIDAGVHVVFTAHSTIRKFEQPDEAGAYDRWELKLGKKTAPLVKEWVDMVLFANYKTFIVRDENGKAKGNGGQRVIYTAHASTWDAKNRHDLAPELPFEYASIAEAIAGVEKIPEINVPTLSPPVSPASNATVETPAAPSVTLPATSIPAHFEALYQLMAAADVSEAELRAAVHARKVYPLATPIENYDPAFVEGSLVAAWPQVLEVVNTIKATVDVPAGRPF